jgi:hypothetical protein
VGYFTHSKSIFVGAGGIHLGTSGLSMLDFGGMNGDDMIKLMIPNKGLGAETKRGGVYGCLNHIEASRGSCHVLGYGKCRLSEDGHPPPI